ncbi:uncharacterized protein LOC124139484 isoform X2 [Haliotis rufescens]|uniref:uncharacterized protein LOC124139484 isoform X2 n=1 Tax=Haliotis rufescens TaxID=6454 RepID=UPI00201F84F8|nr:uncharacterized protein LOC124139484 isoform X2 [Haliotis rufescens]
MSVCAIVVLLLTLETVNAGLRNQGPSQQISDQPTPNNDSFDKHQFLNVIADKQLGVEGLVDELEDRARELQTGQDWDSALGTVYGVTEDANNVVEDAFLYLERAFVQLWTSHRDGPEPPFCGVSVEYVLSGKDGHGVIDYDLASTFLSNDLQCFASKVKDIFREFEDHSEEDDLPTSSLLKGIKDVLSKLIDLHDFGRGLQTAVTIMRQETEATQELGLTEGQGQATTEAATEELGPDGEGQLQGRSEHEGDWEEDEEGDEEEEEDRLEKEVTTLLGRYILERNSRQVGDADSQGISRRRRSAPLSARLARYILYTV